MGSRGMLAVVALVQLLGSAALQAADAVSCQFAWDVSHEQAPVSYTHLDVYKRQPPTPTRRYTLAGRTVPSRAGTSARKLSLIHI